MKKIILSVVLSTLVTAGLVAQCEKKIVWTGSRAEFLNPNGDIQKTTEEKVSLETSKSEVRLRHNDSDADELTGNISGKTCDWPEPYKNGKTVIRTTLVEKSGDSHPAVITIETKNGKTVIHIELTEKGMTIRVPVDSFEVEK